MEEKLLNKILEELSEIKSNQNKMSMQITELSIGQIALSNKIDATKKELREEFKKDIADLRAELKQDIANLREEFKQDIADLRAELKQDIANLREEFKQDIDEVKVELKEVKEVAEFSKETCETIMRVYEKDKKIQNDSIKRINNKLTLIRTQK